MFAVDAAVAANKERGRHGVDAAVERGELVVSQRHRVVHPEFLVERPHWVNAVVERDSDDSQPLVAIAVFELDKTWNLNSAGAAPGRPKVEQDDFAPVIGQVELVPVNVR